MAKFLDANHPMFRPVWVRWLTALIPLGWAGLEFYWNNVFWAVLFGAAGAYAFWVLVVKGPDPDDQA